MRIDMSTFAIVPFFENMAHDYPRLKSIELIQSNRSKTMVQKRKNCIRSIPYLGYLVLPGQCELDSVVIPSGLPSSLQSLELRFLMVRLSQIMNGIRIRELAIDRVHMSDEDFFHFSDVFPLLENLTVSYVHRADDRARLRRRKLRR